MKRKMLLAAACAAALWSAAAMAVPTVDDVTAADRAGDYPKAESMVREVIAAATVTAVRLPVTGSTSANTGRAPTYTTAFEVAMKENDGTTTSSPRSTPATTSARCSAVVQLVTATA